MNEGGRKGGGREGGRQCVREMSKCERVNVCVVKMIVWVGESGCQCD